MTATFYLLSLRPQLKKHGFSTIFTYPSPFSPILPRQPHLRRHEKKKNAKNQRQGDGKRIGAGILIMPPAALRGRLRGGRQGAAPPAPPICTAWPFFYAKLTSQIVFLRIL